MGDRVEAESASLPAPGPFTAAAVDAAGERVATAGPRGVAVFDAPPGGGAGAWALAAAWELEGGAVPTQIAIGHPDHGSVLAVASSDGALTLWHEACGPPPRAWARAARFVSADGAAPTALAFAPAAAGPRLAAGCADGSVRVYVATALLAGPGCGWELESVVDAGASGNRAPACVTWRPHDAGAPGGDLPALLAVGGRDGVALHCYSPAAATWMRAATLPAPAPATAVAWAAAPAPAAPDTVAVAAGARVDIWHVRGSADSLTVECTASLPHSSPVWRLEWQPLSGALIAGTDDGKVVAWRAGLAGDWVPVGAVVADGAVPPDATAVAV